MNTLKYRLSKWLIGCFVIFQSCTDEQPFPIADFKLAGVFDSIEFKHLLDASMSICLDEAAQPLQYRWDLNGDHIWTEASWSHSPFLSISTTKEIWSGVVGLQVKDANENVTEIFKTFWGNTYDVGPNVKFMVEGTYVETIYFQDEKLWFTTQNVQLRNADGIMNRPNYGSYFTWMQANESYNAVLSLPTLADWNKMIARFGGLELAGHNLTTDVDLGLKLVYGGYFSDNAIDVFDMGKHGYYWTSTEASDETAYAIKITQDSGVVEIVQMPKNTKLSVRLFYNYQEQTNNESL